MRRHEDLHTVEVFAKTIHRFTHKLYFRVFHDGGDYLTRFKAGLAAFAAGDALRVAEAKMAPAFFIGIPSFLEMDD